MSDQEHALLLALFEKYQSAMLLKARRYVRAEADVQDLLSENLLRLIPHLKTIQVLEEHQQYAYVMSAVKHTAISMFRRKENANLLLSQLERIEVPAPDEQAAQSLTMVDLWETILQVLSTLPPAQQQVFLLHYKMELSIDEIAELLHLSPNLVRAHLSRGRRKLQKYLKENDAL